MQWKTSRSASRIAKRRGWRSIRRRRKVLDLAASVLFGLMFGSGIALVRGWTNQKLGDSQEIRTRLGMPVLCAIPHIRTASSPITRGQMVHLDPNSEAAEAYRAVR